MTAEVTGAVLWAVRMLLVSGGGWMASRGIGDSELWSGLADVGAGAIVSAVGALWSWYARRAALAAEPPK